MQICVHIFLAAEKLLLKILFKLKQFVENAMLLAGEAEEVDWKQRYWQDDYSVRERQEICRGLYDFVVNLNKYEFCYIFICSITNHTAQQREKTVEHDGQGYQLLQPP